MRRVAERDVISGLRTRCTIGNRLAREGKEHSGSDTYSLSWLDVDGFLDVVVVTVSLLEDVCCCLYCVACSDHVGVTSLEVTCHGWMMFVSTV